MKAALTELLTYNIKMATSIEDLAERLLSEGVTVRGYSGKTIKTLKDEIRHFKFIVREMNDLDALRLQDVRRLQAENERLQAELRKRPPVFKIQAVGEGAEKESTQQTSEKLSKGQIKRALECCSLAIGEACRNCPVDERTKDACECCSFLARSALSVIESQEKRISSQKALIEGIQSANESTFRLEIEQCERDLEAHRHKL